MPATVEFDLPIAATTHGIERHTPLGIACFEAMLLEPPANGCLTNAQLTGNALDRQALFDQRLKLLPSQAAFGPMLASPNGLKTEGLKPVTHRRWVFAGQLRDRVQRHPSLQALFEELPVHAENMSLRSDGKYEQVFDSADDLLGAGYALDQGGALAAEGGAAFVVVLLSGFGDLGFYAALLEEEEVELHRLG